MKNIKITVAMLILVCLFLCSGNCQGASENSEQYLENVSAVADNFDQVQASLEVAFDASLYIGSIQKLNFEHKKFQEAYKDKKERRYLSFALESSIVNTYLGLVTKIKADSGNVTQDEVNRVIDDNQRKISLLRDAVKAENDEGSKTAWLNLINKLKEEGDFLPALEYSKLAIEKYGNELEFQDALKEVQDYISKINQDAETAGSLMEEKKYREALLLLKNLVKVRTDDTEIARMYETASSYVEKMDKLIVDAKAYEEEKKLKEAFRTWENLLEYDPENEEAKAKIEEYSSQLKLSTTEIVTTCEGCVGHGYCNICRGSGLCLVCNGYRKCIKCRGAGYFSRSCPACLCHDCRGGGICSACNGYGTVTCNSCGGSGFHRTTESFKCSVCNGTGKSRFRDAPCPGCGGAGNIMRNVDNICTVCNGAKVLPCNTCGGSGKCKTCFGRGHTPNCSQCNGSGVLTSPCTYCNRTGVCLECNGNGVCKYCKGSGKCADCNGFGATVQKIDEGKYLDEKNHFISVVSEPRGAQVFLDGKPKGVTPVELENVDAGKHHVRISKQGYNDFNYRTIFTESSVAKLDIKLVSKISSMYRVVSIAKNKHALLFRHYQEQENGSFMISLYVDGTNDWKELGDTVLGYNIAEMKREYKSNYNPRLKEKQIVDVSSLILRKRDGTEIKVPMGTSFQPVVYKAKIYDNASKQFIYAGEGAELGDFIVHSISDNEVVIQDKSGNSFTLMRK